MAGYTPRTSQLGRALPHGRDEARASNRPSSDRLPSQRREEAAHRDEAPSAGIGEDGIERSVRAVERAAANFAALRDNCNHYRELAIELRRAFDDEKEHAKVFAQQLADADRARRADRERADRAERRLEQAAQAIHELERQLATTRARADRLEHSLDRLAGGERVRAGRGIDGDLADLLAA